MWSDLVASYAVSAAPLFTLVSVLTQESRSGTTSISSFVRAILLAPLPCPDAERLVTITRQPGAEFSGLQVWGRTWRRSLSLTLLLPNLRTPI
jgi:hypothetical protein